VSTLKIVSVSLYADADAEGYKAACSSLSEIERDKESFS